jgi:hypothetical protein
MADKRFLTIPAHFFASPQAFAEFVRTVKMRLKDAA